MRSRPVIVFRERYHLPVQSRFVEDDHMIQALPAKRADEVLSVSPLPGGSWCTKHLFDAHVLNLSGQVVAKDSIPVSQQIARRRVPGERIAKLLGGSIPRSDEPSR
jgi:hypothetical protein